MPHEAEIGPRLVIGDDQDDVGFRLLSETKRKGEETQEEGTERSFLHEWN
jgi:hypothetical protein